MEEQIEQLYKPLFLYIKKRVNNQADAEDLTQEVFYKLSRSSNDQVDNIKSWTYTIAKNTITDYYRKKKLIVDEVQDIPVVEEDETVSVAELSKCIGQYIDQLPEDYREIMTLSELEEVPQKEIAERLNMNYVTVRSKIQRGRKRLRELYSECCLVIQGGKGSIMEVIKRPEDIQDKECC